MSAAVRVVFDTNVVLSALLFRQGRLAPLRALWQSGQCLPLVSKATADELLRALRYPKFRLTSEAQQELIADFLPFCEVVVPRGTRGKLPVCRDPADQVFLEVAVAGKAKYLVSGDRDLLALAGKVPFKLVSPAEFLESEATR
jgi:putative PIN family toxin of toxin-antitoxin system